MCGRAGVSGPFQTGGAAFADAFHGACALAQNCGAHISECFGMEVRMIKRLKAGWRRALGYFRRNGISAAAWAVAERLWQEMQQKGYRYEPPGQDVLLRQRRESETFENPPLLSVVMPAYETPPGFLRALLDSMRGQTWPYWELVVADAGGSGGLHRTSGP